MSERPWTPSFLFPNGIGGKKLRIKDLPKEQRNAYGRACGQKFRKSRIEKSGGPKALLDTPKAKTAREHAVKVYQAKKAKNLEATLAAGREHQRQLRLKRDGGPVGRLVKNALKSVLRPYIERDRQIHRQRQENERRRQRYSEDDIYRFRCRLRVRLVTYMRTTGHVVFKENQKTTELVGKPAYELLKLLEDSSGLVAASSEADHTFALSLFDLSIPDNVKRVMHWSNYQLLTMGENRKKSDKLPTKAMAAKVERWAWPDGVTEDMLPDIYPGWSTALRM